MLSAWEAVFYTSIHALKSRTVNWLLLKSTVAKGKKLPDSCLRLYRGYQLDRSILWFVRTVGLSDDIRIIAEETAKECGFQKIQWLQANGVITTHGGPAAFGLAGFTE